MIVECLSIYGKDVPEESRFPGESIEARYEPLKIGGSYMVFAIIFYRNRVDYLVDAGKGGPDWMPACLFSIKDEHIASDLQMVDLTADKKFTSLCENFGARFMIGYEAITRSYQHFVGLLEREQDALDVFYQEKIKKQPINSYFDT
jgi:hypothetical protein